MNVLNLDAEVKVLDINLGSLFSELDRGCDVEFVRRKSWRQFKIIRKMVSLSYLSSPVENPRSKFGGIVPDILYVPSASTLGIDSSMSQVLLSKC